MILPVILCGGSGTRLWPLSRKLYPKQFHCFHGKKSLLQQTAERAVAIASGNPLLVVTNEEQKFIVVDQLAETDGVSILIEPQAKNTAPAIALAAWWACTGADDPVLLAMPADHLIPDTDAFKRVIAAAEPWAEENRLVTFGIRPVSAETGYGYIELGPKLDSSNGIFEVGRFIEKPDREKAERLVEQGDCVWNSGIFLFKASTYLDELQRLCPDIYTACEAAAADMPRDGRFVTAQAQPFDSCPAISIDYAVMEKTKKTVVVPFEGVWSDIGSWSGLADTVQRDHGQSTHDNITVGQVYAQEVANTYIHATSRLVTAIGVKDAIIVETPDAVLVTDKRCDQKIKHLVEQLSREGRHEVEHHTRVFRPWGSYESLQSGEGFQVKRLIIKPGASISLQRHQKRSEHWVVIRGEAEVTKGEQKLTLKINQSTFIPKKTLHKLENHGDQDLEIIEVQTGEYLGEDDIERFEDKYGRV